MLAETEKARFEAAMALAEAGEERRKLRKERAIFEAQRLAEEAQRRIRRLEERESLEAECRRVLERREVTIREEAFERAVADRARLIANQVLAEPQSSSTGSSTGASGTSSGAGANSADSAAASSTTQSSALQSSTAASSRTMLSSATALITATASISGVSNPRGAFLVPSPPPYSPGPRSRSRPRSPMTPSPRIARASEEEEKSKREHAEREAAAAVQAQKQREMWVEIERERRKLQEERSKLEAERLAEMERDLRARVESARRGLEQERSWAQQHAKGAAAKEDLLAKKEEPKQGYPNVLVISKMPVEDESMDQQRISSVAQRANENRDQLEAGASKASEDTRSESSGNTKALISPYKVLEPLKPQINKANPTPFGEIVGRAFVPHLKFPTPRDPPFRTRGKPSSDRATDAGASSESASFDEDAPNSTKSSEGTGAWTELIDETTGSTYFFNQHTNETTWQHPLQSQREVRMHEAKGGADRSAGESGHGGQDAWHDGHADDQHQYEEHGDDPNTEYYDGQNEWTATNTADFGQEEWREHEGATSDQAQWSVHADGNALDEWKWQEEGAFGKDESALRGNAQGPIRPQSAGNPPKHLWKRAGSLARFAGHASLPSHAAKWGASHEPDEQDAWRDGHTDDQQQEEEYNEDHTAEYENQQTREAYGTRQRGESDNSEWTDHGWTEKGAESSQDREWTDQGYDHGTSTSTRGARLGSSAWEMHTDEKSGAPYWLNATTGEATWEDPNGSDAGALAPVSEGGFYDMNEGEAQEQSSDDEYSQAHDLSESYDFADPEQDQVQPRASQAPAQNLNQSNAQDQAFSPNGGADSATRAEDQPSPGETQKSPLVRHRSLRVKASAKEAPEWHPRSAREDYHGYHDGGGGGYGQQEATSNWQHENDYQGGQEGSYGQYGDDEPGEYERHADTWVESGGANPAYAHSPQQEYQEASSFYNDTGQGEYYTDHVGDGHVIEGEDEETGGSMPTEPWYSQSNATG